MKTILPKTIFILGKTWKLKQSRDGNCGYFTTSGQYIGIGTKDGNEHSFQVFLHEVLELILAEFAFRYHIYCNQENTQYLFNFTHEDLNRIIPELASALLQLKRLP